VRTILAANAFVDSRAVKIRQRCLALSIVMLALSACSAAPAPVTTKTAEPQATPHVGSIVDAGNWRYQVMQVDTARQVRWGQRAMDAKGLWIIVMIDLTNIGNRSFALTESDLRLVDDKGTTYDSNSESSAYARSLGQASLGELAAGAKIRTTMLFDVASGTTGIKLRLVQGGPDIRLE
jgi:hypothetical protein